MENNERKGPGVGGELPKCPEGRIRLGLLREGTVDTGAPGLWNRIGSKENKENWMKAGNGRSTLELGQEGAWV